MIFGQGTNNSRMKLVQSVVASDQLTTVILPTVVALHPSRLFPSKAIKTPTNEDVLVASTAFAEALLSAKICSPRGIRPERFNSVIDDMYDDRVSGVGCKKCFIC